MDDDPDVLSARIEAVREQWAAAWTADGAVTARVLAWNRMLDGLILRWYRAQEPKALGYRPKAGG
jgi:nitrate reductase alpha subunit